MKLLRKFMGYAEVSYVKQQDIFMQIQFEGKDER